MTALGSWRPQVQSADGSLRPTRAQVDLAALRHNVELLAARLGPTEMLAVVKADAYGHGAVRVAKGLAGSSIAGFGVALAEEGLELRAAGVKKPILVLNGVYGGAYNEVLEAGLTPVIYNLQDAHAFRAAARGRVFSVHLKVDTGMARLGVPMAELPAWLDAAADIPGMCIDGVMTHFASAGEDDAYTAQQLVQFRAAIAQLAARGHRPKKIHAANSAGALCHPEARFDMVRPGLVLYGTAPPRVRDLDLHPTMRIVTEVIALRDVPRGARVGYSGTFVASRPTRIATVPIGYGDGLPRSLSGRGAMLLGGRRAPIAGLVSMDLTMLDVTDVPAVSLGAEVVVLGTDGTHTITASDLAGAAGISPYEVLTNVSRRVPRFYT